MLRVTGEVVGIEQRAWRFTPEGETTERAGVTRTIKVQTSRSTIIDVKVPDNFPLPNDGQQVDVQVQANARNGRVALTLLGDYSAVSRQGELTGKAS